MKKVTEQDVERILSRYINVDEQLVRKIQVSEDTDDLRQALFDSVLRGIDVSFALMYDWVIEALANKILEMSGKKKEKKGHRTEQAKEILTHKILSGKGKNKKEDMMLKRVKRLNLSREEIWERYNKSFEGKTKEELFNYMREVE